MSEPTTYRIDRSDNLVFLDDAWIRFGANNGLMLTPHELVGKPLWGFISDSHTRELYYYALKRVREGHGLLQLPFRCDAPNRHRDMILEMQTHPDEQIQFRSITVMESDRPPVDVFAPDTPRSSAHLNVCSWCKKVELPGAQWKEVEVAIAELQLFEATRSPTIRHLNCPACVEKIRADVDQYVRSN